MPNIYTVMSMVKPNDRLVSIDLSNAYSSLKIRDSHQKFLQFTFEGRHYMYLVLPNGIAIGPRVFIETTKAITRFLRKRGVNMIIYIDDTLLIDKCPTTLGNHTQLALQTFQKCGFVINFEKSQLNPSTKAEFLGFWFDTVAFTITLTEAKTEVALKLVRKLLRVKFKCRIRMVAKVIGTLVALFPCCEDGPLYYRSLERDKIKALRVTGSWNACMVLSNSGREELQWWKNVLTQGPPSKSLKQRSYNIDFYSDATLEGWGVLIKGVNANGTFSEKQSSLSINTKELLAIYYRLASFKIHITGQNILCHCDNTTAVSCIVKKGSSDKIRNAITKKIFHFIREVQANIYCVHISGVDNGVADKLSRTEFRNSRTEWSLSSETMNFIWNNLEFQPNIDLFASHLNYKIKPYCSFRPDPFCMRVDAFTLNWREWNPFAYPPFSLLNRCLSKLDVDDVKNIAMIVPIWPTAPFFGNLIRHLKRPPVLLPPNTVKLMRLPWDQHATYPVKKLKISFNTFVRRLLRSQNMPPRVAEHIADNGWRQSTALVMNTATKRWVQFCKIGSKKPFDFEINQVLEFLEYLSSELKLSYNAVRDGKQFVMAINKLKKVPMSPADKEVIAKFMTAVFNKRTAH